ncbi:MAG: type III secretion system domain-containing protein [Kluyvera sp.]|uniref:type III secretion system domain-containing protein n=1 Tax=Kluyvera sp. TaxID=1538228 RepID=UPI003F37F64F
MENNQLWHRLVWTPCEWMHDDWWEVLEVNLWRAAYPRMPETAKRALNLEVQRRRQQHGAMNYAGYIQSPRQETLLRAIHRLPTLLLALGLSLSQCPDYFAWRPYRQALGSMLSSDQLTQLWSLWRGGSRTPDISPDELVSHLLNLGTIALHHELSDEPVWQALRYTLPNQRGKIVSSGDDAVALFLRLERFL